MEMLLLPYEALARYGVSREVPCSALKGETVPDSLPVAPHERLTELPVLLREKPHTSTTARENLRDAPVIGSPWVGPGKPNLPLGLRGKAEGCS